MLIDTPVPKTFHTIQTTSLVIRLRLPLALECLLVYQTMHSRCGLTRAMYSLIVAFLDLNSTVFQCDLQYHQFLWLLQCIGSDASCNIIGKGLKFSQCLSQHFPLPSPPYCCLHLAVCKSSPLLLALKPVTTFLKRNGCKGSVKPEDVVSLCTDGNVFSLTSTLASAIQLPLGGRWVFEDMK